MLGSQGSKHQFIEHKTWIANISHNIPKHATKQNNTFIMATHYSEEGSSTPLTPASTQSTVQYIPIEPHIDGSEPAVDADNSFDF